ncbi:DNA repair protein RadC [Commensalibacter communis]|uniref:JAB domain-containing protein n=1 Tax=Commensalibacter communis TaxID=2972786 RepID=UPI0022FFB246|nr:JAB domain-containing protein [Commensalibacter communis]CAI3936197.1 DNA repair protein RadC [Commensalibacter communis]
MNNSFLPPVSKRSKQFTTLNGVGHRGRMRSKLLQKGGQAFEDYELLEMLLYLVIPRRDTKPLAKQLINSFGSLDGVFTASTELLEKEKLSQELIQLISLLKQLIERFTLPDFQNRPYLKRWKDVIVYLNEYPMDKNDNHKHMLRLLFLNNQQKLICDEYILHENTKSISLIIQKALNLYATHLITIYYGVGNEFTPLMRKNETKFSMILQSSAHHFDLNLGDHIICFDSQYFSVLKSTNLSI